MTDLTASIANMVREAERHADDTSAERLRALQYYRGEMDDLPAEPGRSSLTSRDVRAHIKKVLPSVMRTILGGASVVEYQPKQQGDEAVADQATDYVNQVLIEEAGVRLAIETAIHDALLVRNGIIKWWWEDKTTVRYSRHTGLTEDAMAILAGDDGVEVVEHTGSEAMIEGQPVALHDVKIKRTFNDSAVRVAAVPRERFLIHPDAVTLADSLLTGEKTEVRRSDLVAMGYDRALVDGLPVSDVDDSEASDRRDFEPSKTEAQKANEPLAYYDIFVRVDTDGDGISELRHMVFAGGLSAKNLLLDEEAEDVQFCDLAVMRQPHQWEGISLADDLVDLQRGKTVLIRQTLDNIYWQNNPQPVAQRGTIENPDAVLTPEFGKPIWVREGVPVGDAYTVQRVPFVAAQSFAMLDYLDAEASDRTGVSDASSGLAPDALQNVTATASAMIEQAGIGQTELMVRTLADGLRPLFQGILKLIVRHQDVPRTVRLRGEWVQFDPRTWNSDMDCEVNTGLGAGTRERDMAVMSQVIAMQEKLLGAFGPSNNPFVKAQHLYAALSKMVESAGLRTPGTYFHEPTPEEIQAIEQAQSQKPDPEQMKLQAQMQMEQVKQQTQAAKEQAQMQADLQVKRAEIEAEAMRQKDKLASDAALKAQQIAWEREKLAADIALRREEMAIKREDARQQALAAAIRPHLVAPDDAA